MMPGKLKYKLKDSSLASRPPGLGDSLLDSARRGEFNGIKLEAVACL